MTENKNQAEQAERAPSGDVHERQLVLDLCNIAVTFGGKSMLEAAIGRTVHQFLARRATAGNAAPTDADAPTHASWECMGQCPEHRATPAAAPGELPAARIASEYVDEFGPYAPCYSPDDVREVLASNAGVPSIRSGAAPAIPEGFALVPLIPNAEMVAVMSEEEWAWEDLLAAAEAITEKQYNEIAAAPSPDTSEGKTSPVGVERKA
jgi:hypothetical protein